MCDVHLEGIYCVSCAFGRHIRWYCAFGRHIYIYIYIYGVVGEMVVGECVEDLSFETSAVYIALQPSYSILRLYLCCGLVHLVAVLANWLLYRLIGCCIGNLLVVLANCLVYWVFVWLFWFRLLIWKGCSPPWMLSEDSSQTHHTIIIQHKLNTIIQYKLNTKIQHKYVRDH